MADLIDRQAAIDAVYESAAGRQMLAGHKDLITILKAIPSAQPDFYDYSDIEPLWGSFAKEHDVNLTDGAKQLKDAMWVGYRKGKQDAQPEQRWIPVTKKAHPDLPIRVQVQMYNGWIITAYYQEGEWLSVPDCGEPLLDNWIEAWRELPEPWKGEEL